jgi:membrane-bound lytic murein transglycosylase B
LGQLVPFPPRSNDPVEQERRMQAWREAETQAQRQPPVGRPYHQRPEVQRLIREIADGDQAEYQRLMALVERVALPRATVNIDPGARPPDSRTSLERSVRPYLDSGIQRGTAYALAFGSQVEEAARRHGVDGEAIYGTLRGETNMGGFSGGHNAFQQIVRAAFDGSRTEFFRGELRALVQVARERNWDLATLGGSSAGALGWCQFMPSNLVLLAGDLDPWHPVQSAELAARFYENVGRDRPGERYIAGQPIGVELRGTAAAIRRLQDDREMTVAQLRAAGFAVPSSFPANTRGRVFRFGSEANPEAFFSGPNAITIRRYNWGERHYGDRAGLLAGRIMEAVRRERANP